MKLPGTKGRLGLAAGLVGGSVGVALISGFGPAPALSSIGSSHDDTTTTTAVPASVPASTASDASETRAIDAAGAGTVVVAREGNQLTLLSATPNAGWAVEVEQDAGAEIEVDFRRDGQRVQVDVEVEDGAIRERVRFRDEVAGTEVRIENGVVVRTEGFDDGVPGDDDNRGPGSDNRGPGNAGDVDADHADDDGIDDHGHDVNDDHGTDDVNDDYGGDRSGASGSGSGGADDPDGSDHGGDD
jgi:hypothetical protein